MTKNTVHTNKEEETNHSHFSDTNTIITTATTITTSLDPNNPKPLTPSQRAELDALSNLSDEAVRKEAETDPDCEPLDKPGTVE